MASKGKLAKKNNDPPPKHVEQGQEGLENVGQADLIIPRLVIMQALSPQVEEGTRKKGEVINSLTQEVWIPKDEVVPFVPIYHFKEWIQWGPRDTNEGIIDRSTDPDSDLAMSVKRSEKDAEGNFVVTEYHNFIAIFPEHGIEKPVIIPCCRSNHKHGRRLLGLAKYRGNYPLFAGLYHLKAQKEENKQSQKYFAWEFENAGWVDKDEFKIMRKVYDIIKSTHWKDAGPVQETEGEPISDEI